MFAGARNRGGRISWTSRVVSGVKKHGSSSQAEDLSGLAKPPGRNFDAWLRDVQYTETEALFDNEPQIETPFNSGPYSQTWSWKEHALPFSRFRRD